MARQVPNNSNEFPGFNITAETWNLGPKALNDFFSNRPAFRGRNNANQTIANNTWTPIGWALNMLDTDMGHNTVTNNTRYVCQVAGWYWVRGSISWNTSGVGNVACRIDASIAKNGSTWTGSAQFQTKGANVSSAQSASALVQLNQGDYVELWVRQFTGGNLNIDLGFGIECGFDAWWVHQ